MTEYKVSVIIPVYNAEKYLSKAVDSAVTLKEVGEIILVEDGSTDNSLSHCQKLCKEHKNVLMFRHEGGDNRGAGASRNLGLRHAVFDFVSFLDADDFYLPNRFSDTFNVMNLTGAEGVFESVGSYYYSQESRLLHIERLRSSRNPFENDDRTMLRVLQGEDVFTALFAGGKGWIHLDGLTLRTSSLAKIGPFDKDLLISQDTDFVMRCAYYSDLSPGNLDKVVACRGVHDSNRIIAGNKREQFNRKKNLQKKMFHFYRKKQISGAVGLELTLRYSEAFDYYYNTSGIIRKILKAFVLLFCFVRYPGLINFFFK